AGRPLSVEFNPGLDPIAVDTSELIEWRTHWGEVERVHQVEIELAKVADIRLDWQVTPHLVVATTEPDHQYSRSLYEKMSDTAVVAAGSPDSDLLHRLRSVDVLHMAWPERWVGLDP